MFYINNLLLLILQDLEPYQLNNVFYHPLPTFRLPFQLFLTTHLLDLLHHMFIQKLFYLQHLSNLIKIFHGQISKAFRLKFALVK